MMEKINEQQKLMMEQQQQFMQMMMNVGMGKSTAAEGNGKGGESQMIPMPDEASQANSCQLVSVESPGRTECGTRMRTAGKTRRMRTIAQNGGSARNRMNRG
jgi:hypothetical protein